MTTGVNRALVFKVVGYFCTLLGVMCCFCDVVPGGEVKVRNTAIVLAILGVIATTTMLPCARRSVWTIVLAAILYLWNALALVNFSWRYLPWS